MAEKPTPADVLRSAVTWAYRVMAISLSMALPALGGYWLDSKLGTGFVFVVVGALFGFALGMIQLLGLAKAANRKQQEVNRITRDASDGKASNGSSADSSNR